MYSIETKKICLYLNTYYDCVTFNNSSNIIRKEFEKTIKTQTLKKNKNKNITLIRLIQNYYKPYDNIITNLSGPFSISLYRSEKYKKNVYVFGEFHGYLNSCKKNFDTISPYFTKLFKSTSTFIDFYLEIDHDNMTKYSGNLFLNKLRHTVKKCVNNNTNPDCNLVRAHYTDLRGNYADVSKATNDLSILWHMKDRNDLIDPKYAVIIEKIHKMNWLEFKEYVKFQILSVPKIRKEYERTTERKMIYIFMDDFLEDNKKYWKKTIFSKAKNTNDKYYKMHDSIVRFDMLVMDVYLLSRIFKIFNVSELTFQPSEPHNIIIYCGQWHAETYQKFFLQNDFKLIESATNLSTRCVNFENISQPLFSSLKCF
jgi:hypothetical protein